MKFINRGLVLLAIFITGANAIPDSNSNSNFDDVIKENGFRWINQIKKLKPANAIPDSNSNSNFDDGIEGEGMLWINQIKKLKPANAAPDSNSNSNSNDEIERNGMRFLNQTKKLNLVVAKTNGLDNNEEALSERLKAISASLQEQSESLKALADSQRVLTEKLQRLSEKEDAPERNLPQFMQNTEHNFLILEKSLAKQESMLSLIHDKYLDNVEWTTIMRREDGSVNFERDWAAYQRGFGSQYGEFFVGLDELHDLTTKGPPKELLVVVKDTENEKRIAKYDLFRIGNESQKYALLELGNYVGDAGDSLSQHRGMSFSTYDQDNDLLGDSNCAERYKGAWWFKTCYNSHLFGEYKPGKVDGIDWNMWKALSTSMKFAEMKIRPKKY